MAFLVSHQDERDQCVEDLQRDSCVLYPSQLGVVDAIAAIRMIGSTLSLIGSVSIILPAIVRKQIFSSKVLPIFMLSIADLLLSILWILGGSVWLRGLEEQVWCYAISILTVILECIAVNLTLVYALLAYSGVKNKNLSNIVLRNKCGVFSDQMWHPVVTVSAYLSAWLLPTVVVVVLFGILAGSLNLVADANRCSCWCVPVYGNVLPLANATATDNATSRFVYSVNILLVTNGAILGIHHLIVFILLVIVYSKLLRYIKQIRKEFEERLPHLPNSLERPEGPGMLLITGQSKAKKRILGFLTVFVMTGILNFSLSCLYLIVEGTVLPSGPYHLHFSSSQLAVLYIVLCVHAFIVPLQGFFNAIVYGWTREDFVQLMAIGTSQYDVPGPEESVSHPLHSSLSKSEAASVTDKLVTSFVHNNLCDSKKQS